MTEERGIFVPQAQSAGDGVVSVPLAYPVTADGLEVRSLRIRRPKVRDELAAARATGSNEEREVRLFASLCEVSPETVEALDMEDYRKLQEVYVSFLSRR